MSGPQRTIGEQVTHALVWEAMAAKPGNVNRGADFEDMTFADMTAAAVAIGGVFNRLPKAPLGELVLESVVAMQSTVGRNTHLGTLLLIAPLAIASRQGGELAEHAAAVVASATDNDTQQVYEAIRAAAPGGVGKVDEGDIARAPTTSLLEAMELAAGRDTIARQYTNRFADVLRVAGQIADHLGKASLHDAIVAAHVDQMAHEPDSLIARKLGEEYAQKTQARAGAIGVAGPVGSEAYQAALADLDSWLRADGHRRNPGTTADLIGAALFVLLLEERISWPVPFYSSF